MNKKTGYTLQTLMAQIWPKSCGFSVFATVCTFNLYPLRLGVLMPKTMFPITRFIVAVQPKVFFLPYCLIIHHHHHLIHLIFQVSCQYIHLYTYRSFNLFRMCVFVLSVIVLMLCYSRIAFTSTYIDYVNNISFIHPIHFSKSRSIPGAINKALYNRIEISTTTQWSSAEYQIDYTALLLKFTLTL